MGIRARLRRLFTRNKPTQTSPTATYAPNANAPPHAKTQPAPQAQPPPQTNQTSHGTSPTQPVPPQPEPQAQQPAAGQSGVQQPIVDRAQAAGSSLNIALHNTTSSSSVFATVTGLAIDNNSALFLLQSDGRTPYYPGNVSSPGQPVGQNVAVHLGAPGSTTNIVIPHIAGGRIYFSIGQPLTFQINPGPALVEPSVTNPSDPNINLEWAFCEYTFNAQQLYANISYVDFVSSIPIALNLTTVASGTQSVLGTSTSSLAAICSQLEAQSASDGQGWRNLIVNHPNSNNPLRVLSPNLGRVSNGNLFSGYFEPYVRQVWSHYASTQLSIDTQSGGSAPVLGSTSSGQFSFSGQTFSQPSTSDILTCSTGPFATGSNQMRNAIIPRLAAAFNRSTLLKTNTLPAAENTYYLEQVTNHYSRIVHANNRDGRGYAFPYDDVQPSGGKDLSGEVHAGDPVLWTVTVGGG